MRVGMIQPFPCTRNIKTSKILRANGVEVVCLHNQGPIPTFVREQGYYDKIVKFGNERQLAKKIKEEKIDIVHCHNFPDVFPTVVKLRVPNVPIIHDVHDMTTAYFVPDNNRLDFLEELAVKNSDGLVYVSDMMQDCFKEKYPDLFSQKKHMVIPNLVLKSDVPSPEELGKRFSDTDGKMRMVYQGGISTKSKHRNYLPMWKNITNKGTEVHFYPFFDDFTAMDLARDNDWLFYHAPVSTPELLKNITRYNFGYVGYSDDFLLLQMASPNKLYEYAACGLPVAAQGKFKAIKDVVLKEGLGFVWDTVDELMEKMEKWKDYRKQKIFCIDDRAKEIVRFHEQFL